LGRGAYRAGAGHRGLFPGSRSVQTTGRENDLIRFERLPLGGHEIEKPLEGIFGEAPSFGILGGREIGLGPVELSFQNFGKLRCHTLGEFWHGCCF